MTDIHSFKEETFALIKQQTTRIKTLTKDLQIKDEQIRFLKETICSLEEEKDEYLEKYNEAKAKMQTVIKEVTNYNQNVVHKLYTENESLRARIEEVEKSINQSYESLKNVTEELKKSEEKNQYLTSKLQEKQEKIVSLNKQIENLKKFKPLFEENENRIIRLESLNQQLQQKNSTLEKQVQTLISKCQELTSNYQKKINNIMSHTVDKKIVTKLQEENAKQIRSNEDFQNHLYKVEREKEEAKLQMKINKEKLISIQTKNKIDFGLIQGDIRNLLQSVKLGKKITEFQSKYSQMHYEIYDEFYNLQSKKQQILEKTQLFSNHNEQMERKLYELKNQIDEREQQNQVLREKMKNQIEMLEASYEGKIIQLSIKIQKQEKALYQMTIKNKEFEHLKEQYEKLEENHQNLKQSSENTICQYQKENQKLMEEIQELIQLCDQSINTKNSLNHLKRILHDLLSVIFYLHMKLIERKTLNKNLFLPYLQRFHKNEERTPKQKFRSAVWAVLALLRMKKSGQTKTQKGIINYAHHAIESRYKIDNLSDFLENLMEKALDQKESIELLRFSKKMYQWPHKQLKQLII